MSKSNDYSMKKIDKENWDLDFKYREYEREIEQIKKNQQPIISNINRLLNELNYGKNS